MQPKDLTPIVRHTREPRQMRQEQFSQYRWTTKRSGSVAEIIGMEDPSNEVPTDDLTVEMAYDCLPPIDNCRYQRGIIME
jgi:hypothetical protein